MPGARQLPLSPADLTALTRAIAPRTLDNALGLLAAVVSVPEMLPTQLWLGELLGAGKHKTVDEVQRVAGLVMTLHNFVSRSLMDRRAELFCPGADDEAGCHDFVNGYLEVCVQTSLDPGDGTEAGQVLGMLTGFIATDEELRAEGNSPAKMGTFRKEMRHVLHEFVGALHGMWLEERKPPAAAPVRRDAPEVGRNDACPCGSRKKYKKYHGANA